MLRPATSKNKKATTTIPYIPVQCCMYALFFVLNKTTIKNSARKDQTREKKTVTLIIIFHISFCWCFFFNSFFYFLFSVTFSRNVRSTKGDRESKRIVYGTNGYYWLCGARRALRFTHISNENGLAELDACLPGSSRSPNDFSLSTATRYQGKYIFASLLYIFFCRCRCCQMCHRGITQMVTFSMIYELAKRISSKFGRSVFNVAGSSCSEWL